MVFYLSNQTIRSMGLRNNIHGKAQFLGRFSSFRTYTGNFGIVGQIQGVKPDIIRQGHKISHCRAAGKRDHIYTGTQCGNSFRIWFSGNRVIGGDHMGDTISRLNSVWQRVSGDIGHREKYPAIVEIAKAGENRFCNMLIGDEVRADSALLEFGSRLWANRCHAQIWGGAR